MSLLSIFEPKRTLIPFFAILILLFLAFPVPSSLQTHVSVIGASDAWAGSPDETLKPPTNPPKAARMISTGERASYTSRVLPSRILLSILLRMYWTTGRL